MAPSESGMRLISVGYHEENQGTPQENPRRNFSTVVGGPGTGGNYRHILALPGTAKKVPPTVYC